MYYFFCNITFFVLYWGLCAKVFFKIFFLYRTTRVCKDVINIKYRYIEKKIEY